MTEYWVLVANGHVLPPFYVTLLLVLCSGLRQRSVLAMKLLVG